MRAGPDEIPWNAPGGGIPRIPPARSRSLGLLWLLLLGPVAGALTGLALLILLIWEPGRHDAAAFVAATTLSVAVAFPLSRWLAQALLAERG